MASCVAVLSAANAPLFVLSADLSSNLVDHYSLHTSLDVIEERAAASSTSSASSSITKKPGEQSRELYLGNLYSTESIKVFGYVTNTRVSGSDSVFSCCN